MDLVHMCKIVLGDLDADIWRLATPCTM